MRPSDLCAGSGARIPIAWEDAAERHVERPCPSCGRLLAVTITVGGPTARKLHSPAATKMPPHARGSPARHGADAAEAGGASSTLTLGLAAPPVSSDVARLERARGGALEAGRSTPDGGQP